MDEPFNPPPPPPVAWAEEALAPPAAPGPEVLVSTGRGVKETIESILIAFILAFVFRAFIVEAFVIPTGSMAPTLLGAHMRVTCPDCGYQFDVNYPARSANGDEMVTPDPDRPATKYTTYCQNCRLRVPVEDRDVRYGDRILVLKYLYIPWVSEPRRWDVVVFKTPADSGGRSKDPPYTVNYIKRLVGLPGEELMVLFGDLYKKSAEGRWEVQAKPRHAQDALWRLVYDNDFRPLNKNREDGWVLPWQQVSGAGWDTGDAAQARAFAFDNMKGEGRLRFDHTAVPRPEGKDVRPPDYFTDWLAYDATMPKDDRGAMYGLSNYSTYTVTDLRLCFTYERKAGAGPLRARLTKLGHDFVLEVTPDRVRLLHEAPGRGAAVEVAAVKDVRPPAGAAPLRVEFANVDYQVTVRLNDEVAFQTSYGPDEKEVDDLMRRQETRDTLPAPAVAIDAADQQATLSHVSLWRDVYYTPDGNGDWPRRDVDKPAHSTKLGPDEYFVLGDNSAASSDARYWTQPVSLPGEDLHTAAGRVPGRFMLGRAFFVYWPAGYRPLSRAPALVPDFGDMRLIR